jgi:hypothetical protein
MHSELTGVKVLVTRTPEHAHWLVHLSSTKHLLFNANDSYFTSTFDELKGLFHKIVFYVISYLSDTYFQIKVW